MLTYDSASLLLCIYSKERPIYVHIKACAQMFIVAVSVIRQNMSTWMPLTMMDKQTV